MKRASLIVAIIFLVTAGIAWANDVRRCKAQSSGTIVFLADSIDFRADLTRLYGKLSGIPHTSGRIDYVIMIDDKSGKKIESDDIDGVDFQRWFQWEEDGLIPVEIDLPAMPPRQTLRLQTNSPKGESTWNVTVGTPTRKPSSKKK